MASPGTDIAFSEARTEGYRAFANKIWNAARFLFMNIDRAREAGYHSQHPHCRATVRQAALNVPEWTRPLEARWILARLNSVTAEVERALADYRFDEAANTIYQFFWGDFCDWYLEIVKLRLDFAEKRSTKHRRRHRCHSPLCSLVFEAALRLLSPFMPFITEEIWHALYNGAPPAKSIALTRYPQAADFPADPDRRQPQ